MYSFIIFHYDFFHLVLHFFSSLEMNWLDIVYKQPFWWHKSKLVLFCLIFICFIRTNVCFPYLYQATPSWKKIPLSIYCFFFCFISDLPMIISTHHINSPFLAFFFSEGITKKSEYLPTMICNKSQRHYWVLVKEDLRKSRTEVRRKWETKQCKEKRR